MKTIATYAPTFLGYNNSVLAIVKGQHVKLSKVFCQINQITSGLVSHKSSDSCRKMFSDYYHKLFVVIYNLPIMKAFNFFIKCYFHTTLASRINVELCLLINFWTIFLVLTKVSFFLQCSKMQTCFFQFLWFFKLKC